jgi:hypothetical protein
MAVDNDYEGGKFVEGEYFFDKKRDKRKQTKDVSGPSNRAIRPVVVTRGTVSR